MPSDSPNTVSFTATTISLPPPTTQTPQIHIPHEPPQYPYSPMPQDPYAPMPQTPQNPYFPQPPQYPYPPTPQAPKKRKALLAWIIGGIVGAVVLCSLCSWAINSMIGAQKATISGTTDNQQTTSTTTGTPQSSDTDQNPPASNGSSDGSNSTNNSNGTVAKVGQTITVASTNMACTLVSVKPLTPDEFNQPKAGHEFIYVHIKITNKGSSEQDYDQFDFHIMDGNGNITDSDFSTPKVTQQIMNYAGKLAAGGSVEGDIIFQAPIGDHKARLTWSPSYLDSSTQYMWNLGL